MGSDCGGDSGLPGPSFVSFLARQGLPPGELGLLSDMKHSKLPWQDSFMGPWGTIPGVWEPENKGRQR